MHVGDAFENAMEIKKCRNHLEGDIIESGLIQCQYDNLLIINTKFFNLYTFISRCLFFGFSFVCEHACVYVCL